MNAIQSKKIHQLFTLKHEIFYDFRGENYEAFNQTEFSDFCIKSNLPEIQFVVDSFSFSRKNTLRGFHGDWKTWKILQCLQGSIQLVIIDMRLDSPTKNQTETFYLNDKNRAQILVPAGCVNAHLCLSDTCIFGYKLSNQYVKQEDQLHVFWNEPVYNIYWPIKNPIISERDTSPFLE